MSIRNRIRFFEFTLVIQHKIIKYLMMQIINLSKFYFFNKLQNFNNEIN